MHTIIWKVRTCRQGVKPPLSIITDENRLDYLDWEHEYLKDDNVELNKDGYCTIENNRDDGLWLSTHYYTINKDDADAYYEREVKRFESKFRKHRYFKVTRGEHIGKVFVEADYDGYMHYAEIPHVKFTTRLEHNECSEIKNLDGESMPKKIKSYNDEINLTCPECYEELKSESFTMNSSTKTLTCPHCSTKFNVRANYEITYSATTDLKNSNF